MAKKTTADELVEAIKPTKKSKTKKGYNVKKTIILTVISTVAVIGLFVATFAAGVNHQKRSEANINARVEAAKAEMSKPSQR